MEETLITIDTINKTKTLFEKANLLIIKNENKLLQDSLYNGKLGLCLYFSSVAKARNDINYQQKAINIFYEIIEKINLEISTLKNNSLSAGFSGLGLVAEVLIQHNHLERENVQELLDQLNPIIQKESTMQSITDDQIDNLHGSASSLQYFSQHKVANAAAINEITYYIWNARKETEGTFFWHNAFTFSKTDEGKLLTDINFSFAHGQAGLISILCNCYDTNYGNKIIKDAIKNGLNFCLRFQNEKECADENSMSLFPQNITGPDANLSYNFSNRLAWCYGDLGICEALIKAGNIFEDMKHFASIGESLALQTLYRKTFDETLISETIVCHGYAGNATFYKHFYKLTNNDKFLEGYEYWMGKLIEQLEKELETDYFTEQNTCDLLNGLSGINLVLLEYFTKKETAWSKAILL